MTSLAATTALGSEQLLTLLVVIGGVVVLMAVIRGVGELLSRTHPETPSKQPRPAPAPAAAPKAPQAPPQVETAVVPAMASMDPEILAVITASIHAVIGKPFRILAVSSPKKPSVESLMQVWSWEGRRQIYSSHRVR